MTDFIGRLDKNLVGALNTELDLENESLSGLGQTIGRAINLAFPGFEEGIGVNPLRTRLMKINYQHFRGRGEPIDDARRETISRQFDASNEEVKSRYFPDREKLFANHEARSSGKAEETDLAQALSEMFQQVLADNNVIPQRYVDIFRNAAVRLEKENLAQAYELMNLAHRMRPDGPLIRAKLEEYLARMEAASSAESPPVDPEEGSAGSQG